MFINWNKTKAMILSPTHFKSATKLEFLLLDGSQVEIVDHFKLLGCTIDKKITFEINFRLHTFNTLY